MKIKIFIFTFVVMIIVLSSIKRNDKIVGFSPKVNDSISMPLVKSKYKVFNYGAPQPNRDYIYNKFLNVSLKISTPEGSGSGTIIYYDEQKNEAYVASCGHLWSGTATSQQLKLNPKTCKLTVWYQNEKKLDSPKDYTASVLFWSNERGYDSSLLKFKPDWIPNYFPIAKIDYPFTKNMPLNSLGCDAGSEVALYKVYFEEFRGDDLITNQNSPRPGRSGGGLLSSDGFYVGTCWGTSNVDGSGIGYFTPLKSIYHVYSNNGYDWLLNVSSNLLARKLPIKDINSKQGVYSKDYIIGPNNSYEML